MLLELTQVSKSYPGPSDGPAVAVLDNINLKVDEGESVVIVGPSGSGKSTLLNLIGSLDQPTSGTVRFEGRDLTELGDRELAAFRNQHVGFVFQLHHLLPQCTILENVLIPTLADPARRPAAEAQERARRLLDRVGLQHRHQHRPGQLSGGECQRVAVVRALINQPQLLLADEPTGSLDHASAERLGQILTQLNREEGVALVVVTHSLELARRFNRLYEMRDGQLREA